MQPHCHGIAQQKNGGPEYRNKDKSADQKAEDFPESSHEHATADEQSDQLRKLDHGGDFSKTAGEEMRSAEGSTANVEHEAFASHPEILASVGKQSALGELHPRNFKPGDFTCFKV